MLVPRLTLTGGLALASLFALLAAGCSKTATDVTQGVDEAPAAAEPAFAPAAGEDHASSSASASADDSSAAEGN